MLRGTTLSLGFWLLALPACLLGVLLGSPVAHAQGTGNASTDERQIWTTYMVGMAGYDTVRRERSRQNLVHMGEAVVPHLVEALSTTSVLERLHQYGQLPALRTEMLADLDQWLAANQSNLRRFVHIHGLVEDLRLQTTNDALFEGFRTIRDALARYNESVASPHVLNNLRAFAALALGELGASAHAEAVAAMLAQESREVRARAIQALGRMEASAYASQVEPFLFVHEDIFLRSCAWTALRRMDSHGTVTMLIAELAELDPEDSRRQRSIVEALEGITARSFGTNTVLWQRWWDRAQQSDDPLGLRIAAGH